MHDFETDVSKLKYQVLVEIAKATYEDNLLQGISLIPKKIVPGPKPSMRCCIYKERAIVNERIRVALGGNKDNDNVIEVLDIACDECPVGGYEVTDRCRGCIAKRCIKVCKKGAITYDPKLRRAIIDKDKCVNCGMCAKACQYQAIQNYMRPCEQACKVNAISRADDNRAIIDDNKCIQCGACVAKCPFGAIMDKSQITDIVKLLKNKKEENIYAVVAPSIAVQFKNANLLQVVSGIKELGFTHVVEAAIGADMVSYKEAQELEEKGFLTSSCCPAFVYYVSKYAPKIKDNISTNLSPMATIAKWIKENDKNSKIIFIGPCIAKKKEIQEDRVKDIVDYVLTFEELEALFDARGIELDKLSESELEPASYYGRIFARAGGLSYAVKEALTEQGSSFEVVACQVDGMENIKPAILIAQTNKREFNFVEGMVCNGGCIGGPCSISNELKNKLEIDKYGMQSNKTIKSSIKKYME